MKQGDVTTQVLAEISPINGFTLVGTRDMTLAAGTQAFIIGFKPQFVICLAAEAVNSDGFSVGFADLIQNLNRGIGQDETGNTAGEDEAIANRQSTPAGSYLGKITSAQDNGFTITWTKSGAPLGTLSMRFACFK